LIRVLHLTDPHLFADKAGELRGTVTYESLSAALAHYESSDWRADIAVVTGDLIQDDTFEAYVHFRELLAKLGMPVYCIPGNHDIRALMRDALSQEPFRYCESLDSGNWLIVGVDSCVSGEAGGAVSLAELDRIDAEIAASQAENVMVCLHHPPVPMNSTWLDSVGLDNGDEFLQRIGASGKVQLVVFGHVHQEYDRKFDGIQIIGTPSTCRQFKKGSPLFAVDDHPPAYRCISLYTDGHIDHELVWVNE
jgi:Icc protein